MMKRSLSWRITHAVHNMVAHPLLPVAELLDSAGLRWAADLIFRLHDVTTPDDDRFNKLRYL